MRPRKSPARSVWKSCENVMERIASFRHDRRTGIAPSGNEVKKFAAERLNHMGKAIFTYFMSILLSHVLCMEATNVAQGQCREQMLIISGIDDAGCLQALISDKLGNTWPVRFKYDKLVSFVAGGDRDATSLLMKRKRIGGLIELIVSSSPGMEGDSSLFKCSVSWTVLATENRDPRVKLVEGKYIDFSDGSVVVDTVVLMLRHKTMKLDDVLMRVDHLQAPLRP